MKSQIIMQVRVPKQDDATIKVAFQCGVNIRFVLEYYSDTNQYDLLIASDPDDEKSTYRMKYLYDIREKERDWSVFYDDWYYTGTDGQWYDVYAYVTENDDSYDIRIRLHEIRAHEE